MLPHLHVLLVEDSEDDARLVLTALRHGEWEVFHQRVDSAPAMNRALDARRWDIIISDCSMPNFSGVGALELARERAGDLPVILVSGTTGEEVRARALSAGADDFFFKGDIGGLVSAVAKRLREAQLRRHGAEFGHRLFNQEGGHYA